MKFSKRLAIAAALGCTVPLGSAFAQHNGVNVHPANYGYYYYAQPAAETSPSDIKPVPPAPKGPPAPPMDLPPGEGMPETEKDEKEEDDAKEEEEATCDPCRLIGDIGCGWSLTGWIDQGVTYNGSRPGSRFNGPMVFNDQNTYQMNQLYMVLEKPIKTDECCWDVGGRVDVLYGTDYITTQTIGQETHQDGTPHWNGNPDYGIALTQTYVEIGYGSLSAKVGHFYTPIGYEVVGATGNFFYSHQYTHQYSEPFTHVGVLGTCKKSDQLTLIGGVVNGWDALDRIDDIPSYIGGVTLTSCDKKVTLALAGITGQEPTASVGNRTMYSVVLTTNLTDKLQWVLEHDNGWQKNSLGPGIDAEWYSVTNYVFYTLNECWKFGARYEVMRDDDGTRVVAPRPGNPAVGPFIGNFHEFTIGANYTPHANLNFRPELRWDWFDPSAGNVNRPFDDGNKNSQFTAAMDVIILF